MLNETFGSMSHAAKSTPIGDATPELFRHVTEQAVRHAQANPQDMAAAASTGIFESPQRTVRVDGRGTARASARSFKPDGAAPDAARKCRSTQSLCLANRATIAAAEYLAPSKAILSSYSTFVPPQTRPASRTHVLQTQQGEACLAFQSGALALSVRQGD